MHDTFFITSIEQYSYFAIFIFALFSGYLIPIPEEIILLITGYMARAHLIHLTPAIFVVILAFVIGDNILFKLALKNNKHVAKLIHEVLSLKIISEKRAFFEKHIGATIFTSRFIPFLRFIGPVFSGYIKVPEKTFMLFNTLAIVIYAPFVMWVGYFFNEYFSQIVTEIGKVKHVLFILILIIVGLLISRTVDYFFNKNMDLSK
jgi:membrane protein DedA with SNARE-associated domain